MTTCANVQRYLFLDDTHISRLLDIEKVLNRPDFRDGNPVLEPQNPWEMGGVSHYGTVLYDEKDGLFKFWYLSIPQPKGSGEEMVTMDGQQWLANRTILCYATSKDGLKWDRPNLGQVDFEGSKDNNILRIGKVNVEGAAIIHEPDDPDPGRRYKALYWEHGSGGIKKREDGLVLWTNGESDGIWVSFSPDGVHWTNYEGNPVLKCFSDTCQYVVKDPRTGRYAAYGRFGFTRTVARIESSDFVNWTPPQLVLETDLHELAGSFPDTQFYGMTVDLYEGLYIGGLWVYREGTDGKIDTQLTVSHDGIHWTRVAQRETFLPVFPDGHRGDGMVRPVARYITKDDKVYIFYGMVSGPHSGPNFPANEIIRKDPGSVGLSILRRDGFVSLDAGEEKGHVITRPFRSAGRKLHLNAEVKQGGAIRVSTGHCNSFLDVHGARDGFEQSNMISEDSTDIIVSWPEANLAQLDSEVVRFRISMRKAKLYSYWLD